MTFRSAGRALATGTLMLAALPLRAQGDPAPVAAQEAPTEAVETTAEPIQIIVPARTVVDIEFMDTLNSKTSQSREMFDFRLASPLIIDGRVIAPAGTPGVGEVVHAARARFGGKAGELILAARYLDVNGTRVPLRSLRYGPSQGLDNSGAVNAGSMVAAAVLPIASVVGFLIAGGEVDIPAGTRAHAMTAAETVFPLSE